MDIKHQSLVLDINDTRNYTLIKACQGDQKSRYIDCTLVQNGSVLSLTSSYRAIVKASINNEVKAINSCTMNTSTNVVTVELTSTMLDTPGILNCEITIQDGNQIVTSQAFAVQVRQSTVANETEIKKSKEFGALTDALNKIANVEQNADKVTNLVNNIKDLESANDIITRLTTAETKENQLEEQHKADTTTLSQSIQAVKESAIEEITVVKDTVSDLDKNKVNNTDFNNYKTTNDTAVAKKFDNANTESGTGNLYDQQGNIVATFDYTKILNAVTIQLCIQNLSTSLNYVYCYGMPFNISNKNMFRYYVLSSKDNAFKIAFENNHAHIKKVNGNFSDGEIVTTSVSYLI